MRFKTPACQKNALKHCIQWNVGTACVSECALKTPACRGLRVGPSTLHALQGGHGTTRPYKKGSQKGSRDWMSVARSHALDFIG